MYTGDRVARVPTALETDLQLIRFLVNPSLLAAPRSGISLWSRLLLASSIQSYTRAQSISKTERPIVAPVLSRVNSPKPGVSGEAHLLNLRELDGFVAVLERVCWSV